MSESNSVIEIQSDGSFVQVVRTETRRPINAQAAIRRIQTSSTQEISLLSPDLGNGNFLYFYGSKPNQLFYFKVLDHLKFADVGVEVEGVYEEGVALTPVFSGGIKTGKTYIFTPPKSLRMILILHPNTYSGSHFVWQDRDTGILYQPCVPNLHSNGQICFGSVHAVGLEEYQNIQTWADTTTDMWENAPWNTDLIRAAGDYKKILRFDDASGKNIPYTGDWKKCSIGRLSLGSTLNAGLQALHAYCGSVM